MGGGKSSLEELVERGCRSADALGGIEVKVALAGLGEIERFRGNNTAI